MRMEPQRPNQQEQQSQTWQWSAPQEEKKKTAAQQVRRGEGLRRVGAAFFSALQWAKPQVISLSLRCLLFLLIAITILIIFATAFGSDKIIRFALEYVFGNVIAHNVRESRHHQFLRI